MGAEEQDDGAYRAVFDELLVPVADDFDPDVAPISGGYFGSSPSFQGTVLPGRVTNIATLGVEGYRDKCGGLDASSGTRNRRTWRHIGRG